MNAGGGPVNNVKRLIEDDSQTTGSDSRYNPDMIPHTLSWADRRCQPRIMQIRDSLKFPTMQDRQEDIPEAHKDTFNWIFDDDQLETRVWDSFHNWLRTGDGIYWINGKAGSGKSTLMKYLYQDPRTWDALGEWSGKRRLVKAGFFFWNSGTALQKTQEGLLRGVLLDVLRQCPSLIEVVIPDQCTRATYMSICEGDYQWSQSQLKRAFHNLLCHKKTSIRIFLLIDGIDEYEGDYGELADLLKAAASPSVKIAISSRPYNIFEDAFGDLPRMRLQDLTRRDITAYVDGTLGKNERMMKLIRKDPERAPQLVNEITEKASGVFLWVVLVVKSLLNGLRNHDKIQDLQSRLLLLPADLEALYKHMLGHIDPLYRFQRSQFLQIMQAVPGAPLTMGFSLAAEDDAGSEQVINAPMKIITQAEAFNVCEEMERRLRAACAGLLEVDFPPRAVLSDTEGSRPLDNHSYHRTTFGSKVQYLHRTVRDWFERTEVWGDVTSLTANTPFDPNMSLLRGWILRLKVLPVEAGANIASYGNGNGQIWEIVKEAIAFAKETKVDTDQASAECLALIQELDNIVALLWLESGDRCLWIDGRPMLRKFVEEQGLTSKCIDEPVMEVPQKEHRSVVKLTIAGSEKTVDARRPLSARIAKTLRLWGS
ncbi:hypothetical protein MMC27_000432 [Xylographa pallens]|nr:hypothetical protein [Xylographa pallens]